MELKLEDVFREYPESLQSAHILRSYLTDLFPHEEKLKINLIVNAYEQNVVREIEKAEELDSYIEKLLCSRLISNYGITSDNAEWAVEYWFFAYGKGVLNKNIVLSNVNENRDINANNCIDVKGSGKKAEKGKYIFPNGDVYEGDFIDGKRTGKGKYIFSNGDVYEGDVIDGKLTGKGKCTWSNGDAYEGDMVNDKMHGRGKFILSDGQTWEGLFVDGARLEDKNERNKL